MDETSDQNRIIKQEIIQLDDDDELDQRSNTTVVKKEEQPDVSSDVPKWMLTLMREKVEEGERKDKEWQAKQKKSSTEIDGLRKKVAKLEQNEVKLEEQYQNFIRGAEAEQKSLKEIIEKTPVFIDYSEKLNELRNKVEDLTNQLDEEDRKREQRVTGLKNELEEERRLSNQRVIDLKKLEDDCRLSKERIDELTLMIAKHESETTSNDTPSEAIVNDSMMDIFTTGEDENDCGGTSQRVATSHEKPQIDLHQKASRSGDCSTEKRSSRKRVDESMNDKEKEADGGRNKPKRANRNGDFVTEKRRSRKRVDESMNDEEKEEEEERRTNTVVESEGKKRKRIVATRTFTSSSTTHSIRKIATSRDRSAKKRGNDGSRSKTTESQSLSPKRRRRSGGTSLVMDASSSPLRSSPDSILPSIPPSVTSSVDSSSGTVAEPPSIESQVTTIILKACNDKMKVKKAVQKISKLTASAVTIAKCFRKALLELPLSDTWNVVRAKMSQDVNMDDMNEVVPKAENKLFKLLKAIRDKEPARLDALYARFQDAYLNDFYVSLSKYNKYNEFTAEVTKSVRCLFAARYFAKITHEVELVFHDILTMQSSQAVCQSLVYLLCHPQTNSLTSECLRKALSGDEDARRLITLHMNDKDADVLKWAVNQFADNSCKETAIALLRPATCEDVRGWWASDIKLLEDTCPVYRFNSHVRKPLIKRMPELFYNQANISGLDKMKLLTQLINPVIDAIDRATSATPATSGVDRPREHIVASEGKVLSLKIEIALIALAGYENRMFGMDKRELRLSLASSMAKISKILDRPLCTEVFQLPSSFSNKDCLPGIIADMKKWVEQVENLTKNHSTETPAICNVVWLSTSRVETLQEGSEERGIESME